MPKYIVRIEGLYAVWSTVVDAPITYLMTRVDFEAWYRRECGDAGTIELIDRMGRVDRHGTSALDGTRLEDLVEGNRAGKNESELTLAEIVTEYRDRRGG